MAALGQAPLDAWYLALPAWAGILAQVSRAADLRGAVVKGWLAGLGHFALALSWIVEPFLIDIGRHGWMAPFALVLMAGGLALFWAAAAALAFVGAGRADSGPAPRALAFALLLTLAEMARGHVLTGFPWALPGHIWIDTPALQLAAHFGAYGLTLFTLLLAALPLAFGVRGAGVAVMVLVAIWGWGDLRPLLMPETPASPRPLVRLVQPNAAQDVKWDPDQALSIFQRLRDASADRGAEGDARPALIVWPETALPWLYEPDGGAVRAVSGAATGVPLLFGAQRFQGAQALNSLVLVDAAGRDRVVYDKHHLVPFGEYVPFGDKLFEWFGLSAFAAQQGYGYAKGPGPASFELAGLGRVLPLICYEAVFPQDIRRGMAAGRPDFLLQVTNDAWFGTLSGPFQHAALARLRAVEFGLPMVRVANTGVSAVWDGFGREVGRLPFGSYGHADLPLPRALAVTPYARFGEAPVLLAVLLGGLGLVAMRRRGKTDP